MASLKPAADPAPSGSGIELAPRAGLEMTLNVSPKPAEQQPPQAKPAAAGPAQAPAAVPKPAPLTSAGGGDFEKTLPLIYPEEDKK